MSISDCMDRVNMFNRLDIQMNITRITTEELNKIKEELEIYKQFTTNVATLDANTLVRVSAVAMEALKRGSEVKRS